MKTMLSQIWFGFLFGIGLAVAIFAVSFLPTLFLSNPGGANFGNSLNLNPSELEIVSHREVPEQNDATILATIRNNSSHGWDSIQASADFYDSANNLTDVCYETLPIGISPGAELNFKLACPSTGINMPKHSSYKLRISQAFRSRQ